VEHTVLPLGQPPSHTPPGPASKHSPPLSAHILQLYKDCVAKGIRSKLIFETRGGEEEYSFFCSPQPEAATTAAALSAATTAAAGGSHRQGKKNRASVLDKRRNSVVSDTQESPEKIRGADNMNNSFRIEFEDGDLQQEEMTCSSCLSIHCDIEQPLCLFCGWKVLE
jgi:hypothetical protein